VKKIKILLTFDYELPLGYSVDYRAGLFDPAAALLQRAAHVGVPIVLFADVCSAIRFEQWDKTGYHDLFVRQLQDGLTNGHDIQLHIHPHWMTSDFNSGAFQPSLDFSLSKFREPRQGHTIESIIDAAYNKLDAIGKAVFPAYRCIAYRAGGYDVEPESRRILHKLHQLGVTIDSSVIKEYYSDYNFTHVDYSAAPADSTWLAPLDGPLVKTAKDGMLELPITSKPTTVFDIVARRWKKINSGRRLSARRYRNGGKGFAVEKGEQTLSASIRKMFNPTVLSLDKEHLEVKDLLDIVDSNVEKYLHEERDLILTVIGHPKSMGSYHLDLMENFVKDVRHKYGNEVSFVTYRDVKPQ
jgi:hypothetical protein